MKLITVFFLYFLLCVCGATANSLTTQEAKILQVEEHNPNWFTQGFYLDDNQFFISSGLYGRSTLIKQTQAPLKQIQHKKLNSQYFAEGLTVIGNTLYLLTWKEKTVLLFDKNTLEPTGSLSYQGEGWGLTHRTLVNESNQVDKRDQKEKSEFIMSNGSNSLFFRDQDSFEVTHKITIDNLNFINELEYVNGVIWANRWYDDHLYGINENGCIIAKVDLQPLRKQAVTVNNKNVVNGIAYDATRQGLWVTGKFWSKRFLIAMPAITQKTC